jgi:hypothetical protein
VTRLPGKRKGGIAEKVIVREPQQSNNKGV